MTPIMNLALLTNARKQSSSGSGGGWRERVRYSNEILTLYAKGYPLLSVVSLLILLLRIKFTPTWTEYFASRPRKGNLNLKIPSEMRQYEVRKL